MEKENLNSIILTLLLLVFSTGNFYSWGQVADDKSEEEHIHTNLQKSLENPDDVYELDLSGSGIKSFPLEILKFKNLRKLNISKNNLNNLPTEIGQLKNLEILNCEKNQLRALPIEIGQLKNLEILNCEDNQLGVLAPEIGQLKNLKYLGLGDNQLRILPPEIGQLKNLEVLSCGYNQLNSLPNEIGQLENLEDLYSPHNQLIALPEKIGQLTNLHRLDCGRNKLLNLPSEIGQLRRLQRLDFSRNQLKTLPKEIGQLVNLEIADFSHNKLRLLPKEIKNLRKLQVLNCSNNEFTYIHLLQLNNLEYLDVSNNKIKTISYDNISSFNKLRLHTFLCDGNFVTELPIFVGYIKSIEKLNLSRNRLKTLPIEISRLENLRYLQLKHNLFQAAIPHGLYPFLKKHKYGYSEEIERIVENIKNKSSKRLRSNTKQELEHLKKQAQKTKAITKRLKEQAESAETVSERDSLYNLIEQKELDMSRLELEIKDIKHQEAIEREQARLKAKEDKLKLDHAKALSQRNLIIFSLVALALLVVVLVIFRSRQRQKQANKQLAEQNEEIKQQSEIIAEEREKSDKLLLNILPLSVANELKNTGSAQMKSYEKTSILFTDFKGFTDVASQMSADKLMEELNDCFSAFDEIIKKHKIEKIKTIGDAYMCVGGIPEANTTNPIDAVLAGLEMQAFMQKRRKMKLLEGEEYWQCRLGINTGEIRAGVIGTSKFAYDIWGNAVNIASRMESGGEVNKVNISEDTYNLVKDYFDCEYRGEITVKNGLVLKMYFVNRIKHEYSADKAGIKANDSLLALT